MTTKVVAGDRLRIANVITIRIECEGTITVPSGVVVEIFDDHDDDKPKTRNRLEDYFGN